MKGQNSHHERKMDAKLCALESICAALSSDVESRVLHLKRNMEDAERILTPRSFSGDSETGNPTEEHSRHVQGYLPSPIAFTTKIIVVFIKYLL